MIPEASTLARGRGMWQDVDMKAATDIEIVKAILDGMEDQSNQLKADRIVKVLGKRIRQRHRVRDRQAVARKG